MQSLAFARRQQGHQGSVLNKAAAIRSRKLMMDEGTWRRVRWASLMRSTALKQMFRGTVTQTSVYPREVVKEALAVNAG